MLTEISIHGAKTHNLKVPQLTLPRNSFIVFTGVSGSGKTSLAFDTIFAEGQRLFIESLSTYARQFLQYNKRPEVEAISGLSPAIAIEQKTVSFNPRSTVGTVTEIADYLRLFYTQFGQAYCPEHATKLEGKSVQDVVEHLMSFETGKKIMILAPLIQNRKGSHQHIFPNMLAKGFTKARVNGQVIELASPPELEKNFKHSIELVVDRLVCKNSLKQRYTEAIEMADKLGEGLVIIASMEGDADQVFSTKASCPQCGFSLGRVDHRLFSFNSPIGACPSCNGLGEVEQIDPQQLISNPSLSLEEGAVKGWTPKNNYSFQLLSAFARAHKIPLKTKWNKLNSKMQNLLFFGSDQEFEFKYLSEEGTRLEKFTQFEGIINNLNRRYKETSSDYVRQEIKKLMHLSKCQECRGERLNKQALSVLVNNQHITSMSKQSIEELLAFFEDWKPPSGLAKVSEKITQEIRNRLFFLQSVGLGYLSLARNASTLSGGESQRIRLASQIGSGLTGVIYVLDEPSIGLHQKDNEKLIESLIKLKEIGNTLIVIEHDCDTILAAEHITEIGPLAGKHGGNIVFNGTPESFAKQSSLTADFIYGRKAISKKTKNLKPIKNEFLRLEGAKGNNLQNIDLHIPLGLFSCVTGVSGSGKSSLVNQTLYTALQKHFGLVHDKPPLAHQALKGVEFIHKVISVDQSPIGRTPRSTPSTYIGFFDQIRALFASLPESKLRGYEVGRFSFNTYGGRCENCLGDGEIKIEMHFMPDVYVTCEKCMGKRYNQATLEIYYRGKNIADILDMSVGEAVNFFEPLPGIQKKIKVLQQIGLDYLKLGHRSTILSGGEAQRIKLAKELVKRSSQKALYILDEPTTGLHFADIQLLLDVLLELRDQGHTILVIEHNLDVIEHADWVVDIGPEGGNRGGKMLYSGDVQGLMQAAASSHTGRFLKKHIQQRKKLKGTSINA